MTSVHPPMRKGQGPPGPWREGLGTQPSAVPCQPGRSPSFGWATLGSPVSLPGSEAPPRVGTQPAGRAEVGVDCAAAVLCGPPGTPLPQPGCLHSPPTQRGWDLASLIKDIPNERRVWIALCLHCDGNCKQRGVPKGMPPGPLHRRVAHRLFPRASSPPRSFSADLAVTWLALLHVGPSAVAGKGSHTSETDTRVHPQPGQTNGQEQRRGW